MNQEFQKEDVSRRFHVLNSATAIHRRFPFPFWEDKYMYSVNIEPHKAGRPVGV